MGIINQSTGRGVFLTGPAFFRSIYWQQLFNLVTILHVQRGRGLQYPCQISVRIQTVLLGRLNQAEINGAGLCSARSISEQEVLPGHHEGFNRPLSAVIGDFQPSVFQIANQPLPLATGVMRSLAQQRLGGSVQVEYPVVQLIQDRLSKFSTQFLPSVTSMGMAT